MAVEMMHQQEISIGSIGMEWIPSTEMTFPLLARQVNGELIVPSWH